MNNFTVIELASPDTIRVDPKWQLNRKGNTFIGDKVKIRGLEVPEDKKSEGMVNWRLERLLLDKETAIDCRAPELIDSNDPEDPVVSCTVYLLDTNITYYFPDFVYKGK